MKRFISFIIASIMLFSILPLNGLAAEIEHVEKGDSVICTNLVLFDDYYILTTDASIQTTVQDDATPYAPVQRFTTKSYSHRIYDLNGAFIATFTTTVKGYYFYPSQEAEIVSVTGAYSNQAISGLSYRVEYNGNTATVNITLNGATIGSLGYKISTDGVISQL